MDAQALQKSIKIDIKNASKTTVFSTSIFRDFWLQLGWLSRKSNSQKSSFFANLGHKGAPRRPKSAKMQQKSVPGCPKTPQECQNEAKKRPNPTTRPPQGPSQNLLKPGINQIHNSQYKGGDFQGIGPRGTQEVPQRIPQEDLEGF